jgi:malate-CoA ligase subunit beta
MDIHEYQAKEILAGLGVPIPRGGLAYSPEQAGYRAREIGGDAWVVKAQIHSGGRGQAGGVKVCHSEEEVRDFAATLFGRILVTKQTGAPARWSTGSTSRKPPTSRARSTWASCSTASPSGS